VPEAASAARRVLATVLPDPDDAVYQIVALLTSELIANSVEHSGAPPLSPVRLDIAVTDERVRGTVEAIERELMQDGFVLRYRPQETGVDGLPGTEGVFLPCSFWLADCWHLLGRKKEARELFERLLDVRNDLGLLSEEYDPRAKRQLGNFPQAFSHVALVSCARILGDEDRLLARGD